MRELWGRQSPPLPPPEKNSNAFDFFKILSIHANLPEKNNGSKPNSPGGYVREPWGADSPRKFKYIQ